MSRIAKRIGVALTVGIAASSILAGCGDTDPSDASRDEASRIVADAKAEAESIRSEAEEDAMRKSAAASATLEADEVSANQRPASPTESSAGLPSLIGKGLQYAQDSAQEAGFYALTSHDAAGREREQVLDRNWKVCSQKPAPGSTDTSATVDFGAVKIEESCPSEDQGAEETEVAEETMPKLTGKSAAVAEEALPGASIDFVDGSGAGRVVLIASNWKVCSQKPAAKAPYSGVPVRLTVVKYGEGC